MIERELGRLHHAIKRGAVVTNVMQAIQKWNVDWMSTQVGYSGISVGEGERHCLEYIHTNAHDW
jgi:hypothetical protein